MVDLWNYFMRVRSQYIHRIAGVLWVNWDRRKHKNGEYGVYAVYVYIYIHIYIYTYICILIYICKQHYDLWVWLWRKIIQTLAKTKYIMASYGIKSWQKRRNFLCTAEGYKIVKKKKKQRYKMFEILKIGNKLNYLIITHTVWNYKVWKSN